MTWIIPNPIRFAYNDKDEGGPHIAFGSLPARFAARGLFQV